MGLLKNIKDGWFNYILNSINKRSLSPKLKIAVEERAKICVACPELIITSKVNSNMPKGKCKKCGCSFPAMIFAPRKRCPIGKWGKIES